MHDQASRLRPMSPADILNSTFNLYRDNFKLFAGIAAVILLPEALIVATLLTVGSTLSLLLGELISLAGSVLVTGALAQAVATRNVGNVVGIVDAYRTLGRATMVTLLGVALLNAALVLVGLALLVVPGVYVAVRLVVSAPVTALEKLGVRDSLRRSWDLVGDHWWRVFGIVLVVTILALGLELAVGRLLGSVTGSALGLGLSTAVIGILIQPIQSIALTFVYFDLHALKDGSLTADQPESTSRWGA